MYKVVAPLLLTVMLASCASMAPLPEAAKSDSAIAYLQALAFASEADVVRSLGVNKGRIMEQPWGASFEMTWCPSTEELPGLPGVVHDMAAYCTAHGGTLNGRFCQRASDADQVLFTFHIQDKGICRPGVALHVLLEEPQEDRISDPRYTQHLSEEGFRTQLERREAAEKAASKARIGAEFDRQRAIAEAPAMHRRGTEICKVAANIRFIGAIDAVEGDRIRVLINSAELIGNPGIAPGGFQPGVSWEDVALWHPCHRGGENP
jgi:hypothetical protein